MPRTTKNSINDNNNNNNHNPNVRGFHSLLRTHQNPIFLQLLLFPTSKHNLPIPFLEDTFPSDNVHFRVLSPLFLTLSLSVPLSHFNLRLHSQSLVLFISLNPPLPITCFCPFLFFLVIFSMYGLIQLLLCYLVWMVDVIVVFYVLDQYYTLPSLKIFAVIEEAEGLVISLSFFFFFLFLHLCKLRVSIC